MNRQSFIITTKSELLYTLGSKLSLLSKLSYQNLGLSHKEEQYYLASNEAEYIKFTVGSGIESVYELKIRNKLVKWKINVFVI